MSVNFQSIKESERELFTEFKELCLYCLKTHFHLYEILSNHINQADQLLDDQQYSNITFRCDQVRVRSNDLLGNCIWTIQKNEPRAGHLRFVITIINNIKEIDSINLNIKWIAKLFTKRILTKEIYQHFLEAFRLTNQTIQSIIDEELNADNKISYSENLQLLFSEYEKYLKNTIRNTILIYSENNKQIDNKTLIDLITAFIKLDRSIEHLQGIFKSFTYINKQ